MEGQGGGSSEPPLDQSLLRGPLNFLNLVRKSFKLLLHTPV